MYVYYSLFLLYVTCTMTNDKMDIQILMVNISCILEYVLIDINTFQLSWRCLYVLIALALVLGINLWISGHDWWYQLFTDRVVKLK